ncbi:glycosyl transferase [Chitinophaga varians]|uniref:Glycosyl transferase n=1 Tax=Chitinophaga varians TaxID=2202339 RepID=A0A847RN33_9BACT|nr:glycosyl transferase [Chitinophaga varians]NLR67170.1 glycosyl transferase [Chitinophaga varians]
MNERDTTLYYCTLFDSNYLSRGLAMYTSLAAVCSDFHLYVFAFDDKCLSVLRKMALPHLTVISLAEFEDPELLKVKPGRNRAEYCWTCSSSTILYCIQQFQLPHCTYIDADLLFYNDPHVLMEEMGNHSVMITEHRYTPQYDKSKLSGKYCVQYITFRNNRWGMEALQWWRNACLDWCYDRHEDGKFGDQKYLDDWPSRFLNVWVMENLGGGLALWNIQQYDVFKNGDRLRCREISTGKEFDPIFYHFHYLKYFTDNTIELGRRIITPAVKKLFYEPYILELEACKRRIQAVDPSFDPHGARPRPSGLKATLVTIWRKLRNVYHIYPLKESGI